MKMFLIALTVLGFQVSSYAQSSKHLYQVKVFVNTVKMYEAGLLTRMDDSNISGVTHAGDLSLVVKNLDKSSGEQIIMSKRTDDSMPVFSTSEIVETSSDYLSIDVSLRDRDWLLINPLSWGWGTGGKRGPTDDIAHVVSLSLAPAQNVALGAFAFSATETIHILTNNQQQVSYNRMDTGGKLIESKTISSVAEYQTIINQTGGTVYNVEITRLR
jgi:hypothetical protein